MHLHGVNGVAITGIKRPAGSRLVAQVGEFQIGNNGLGSGGFDKHLNPGIAVQQQAGHQAPLGKLACQQQLRQSIESAYADDIAADKSYRAAETSADAAELSLDFAKIRFEEGASNAVDYTAALVRLDNAKANFIRSKYDYIFKVKVVEFYMGQPITFR